MKSKHALKKRFKKANEMTYLVLILLPRTKANNENPKKVHMKASNGAAMIAAWKSDNITSRDSVEKTRSSTILSIKAAFLVVNGCSDL